MAQPKEMLPIVDKPVIQYVVEEAIQTGIDDILTITGRNERAIEDHFDKLPECTQPFSKYRTQEHGKSVQHLDEWSDIHYVRQKTQSGLGNAMPVSGKISGIR